MINTSSQTSDIRSMRVVGGLLAGVVVLLLVGAGSAVLAAQQFGQNTAFSRFARFVPVESLPLVKNFVKTPAETLSKAFHTESDTSFQKSLNSREYSTIIKGDATGTIDGAEFIAHGNVKQNIAFNGKLDQYKQVVSFGGQSQAGVMTINPGDEAVKVEVLQPNFKDIYLKLNFSQQMAQTITSFVNERTRYRSRANNVEKSTFKLEDYADKYLKLNYQEYFKLIQEQLPKNSTTKLRNVDPEKLHAAYFELYEKLNPDVLSAFDKTFGQWDRFSKLSYQSREQVGQLAAVWVNVEVDPEKFSNVGWEFVSLMPDVIKTHRNEMLKYCEETSLLEDGQAHCKDVFSAEAFENAQEQFNSNPEMRTKMENAFKDFFKNVKFQKVRVAINPVDSSILKMEIEVTADKEAFQKVLKAVGVPQQRVSEFPLEKLTLSITATEVQRGQNLNLQAPSNAESLVEKIRNYMETEKRRRQQYEEESKKEMEKYIQKNPPRPNSRPYVL